MSPGPLLPILQGIIERAYAMPRLVDDAGRFLIGDAGLRHFYGRAIGAAAHDPRPRLLVRHEHRGVRAALYYPDRMVRHLERHDPRHGIDDGNIDAFAHLIEELDHLLLLASRTAAGRAVRLLEMELHAQVTKHLLVVHLLGRLTGRASISPFHRRWARHHLFEKFADGPGEEGERYLVAARLAGRYVDWLDRIGVAERRAELPAFHRRGFDEQVRRIAALN